MKIEFPGNVYVAWNETTSSSLRDISLARSNNSGEYFATDKEINKRCIDPAPHAGEVQIAVGTDNSFFLSWIDRWLNFNFSEVKLFRGKDPLCTTAPTSPSNPWYSFSPRIMVVSDINDSATTFSETIADLFAADDRNVIKACKILMIPFTSALAIFTMSPYTNP